jgi:hypothetical protein
MRSSQSVASSARRGPRTGGTVGQPDDRNRSPIRAASKDRHVSVSVTVPDRYQVTSGELDTARRFADALMAYIVELERHVTARDTAAGEGVAA